MKARGKWQGMLNIARFNWPYYVLAIIVLIASIAGLFLVRDAFLRLICGALLAGSGYFVFGSLTVAHVIYDCSDLYRWHWLKRALRGVDVRKAIFCHSGFDESSAELRENLADVNFQIFDHFDNAQMTEASIRRARVIFPPISGTVSARFDNWPVESETVDAVFGLLAIHELRSETERSAWFSEAKRSLRKGGRVILVEHTRDVANFIAFGPGFLHFHSPSSWRLCWQYAGFCSEAEFRVTPFIRVFVLSKT